jgi:HEAT repeat protein
MRAILIGAFLICAAPARGEEGPRYEGKSLPEWVKELGSVHEQERLAALDALEQFGAAAKDAVPPLLKMLRDRGNSNETPNTLSIVGEAAVEAIAQVGPPVVPALLEALEDDHPRVRGGAALALGYVRPRQLQTVPALKKLLDDREEFVRVSAAIAMWRLERKADNVVPTLAASLRAVAPTLRQRAVLEMGELGPRRKLPFPL